MQFLPFVLAVTIVAQATWTRDHQERSRSLTFTASVSVMGKLTPVTVQFYCDPERTADSTGVIGYKLEVANPESLKPFDFDDFEGPDAPSHARKLLQATVVRNGKAVHSSRESSGSFVRNVFVFEVSDVFDEPGSSAKKTLRALTQDADMFQITITDYRKPDLKLVVPIPIVGKRSDFEWLIAELK